MYAGDGSPSAAALAAYRALSDSQSRNYDRAQDISPRQMLILLEVSERTRASLGQALATGELESARTWNDYVRPTLKSGALGSATGVWQFMPATFHLIVKKYGTQLLAASDADPSSGRARLDLGEGPFADAQVRRVIAETVDGTRGPQDEQLQLLRHNFAVLAFAKHYLSLDSGATTPEEDYLYHFLGTGGGRRVLALARGEARHTLCVKPAEVAEPPAETTPGVTPDTLAGEGLTPTLLMPLLGETTLDVLPPAAPARSVVFRVAPQQRPPAAPPPPVAQVRPRPAAPPPLVVRIRPRPAAAPAGTLSGARDPSVPRRIDDAMLKPNTLRWGGASPERPAGDGIAALLRAEAAIEAMRQGPAAPAQVPRAAPSVPRPVSAQWGFPANSPTVTGNLGMFYRDGRGQSQPYTWAGFMENLARRVRAHDQPALVRGKYGVGFALPGGDMPGWAFDPARPSAVAEFAHANGRTLLIPEALVTGPLSADETRQYKERLAALVRQGEDKPLESLPPAAWSALQYLVFPQLKAPPPHLPEPGTAHPQVQKALHSFRKKVGKDAPDEPAHVNLLTPAERVALELYDQRLAHYAELQAGQQASLAAAPDLNRINKMPPGSRRAAAPHIAAVQTALAARGLLTAPTQKVVRRDKKKKKYTEYKTVPFAGKPDKTLVAALNGFQWRHGLRKTEGVVDAVTLKLLGLPPMGPDIFLPLSGPACPFDGWPETAPLHEPLGAGPVAGSGGAIPGRLSRPRSLLHFTHEAQSTADDPK